MRGRRTAGMEEAVGFCRSGPGDVVGCVHGTMVSQKPEWPFLRHVAGVALGIVVPEHIEGCDGMPAADRPGVDGPGHRGWRFVFDRHRGSHRGHSMCRWRLSFRPLVIDTSGRQGLFSQGAGHVSTQESFVPLARLQPFARTLYEYERDRCPAGYRCSVGRRDRLHRARIRTG